MTLLAAPSPALATDVYEFIIDVIFAMSRSLFFSMRSTSQRWNSLLLLPYKIQKYEKKHKKKAKKKFEHIKYAEEMWKKNPKMLKYFLIKYRIFFTSTPTYSFCKK